MKNWWGKTLLFTAINYILSGKDDSFFGEKIADICIYIDAKIDDDNLNFKRYHWGFDIFKNWDKISVINYQNYIEQKLWIEEELVDKKWLLDNNFDSTKDKVERDWQKFTMYKFVSEIVL